MLTKRSTEYLLGVFMLITLHAQRCLRLCRRVLTGLVPTVAFMDNQDKLRLKMEELGHLECTSWVILMKLGITGLSLIWTEITLKLKFSKLRPEMLVQKLARVI